MGGAEQAEAEAAMAGGSRRVARETGGTDLERAEDGAVEAARLAAEASKAAAERHEAVRAKEEAVAEAARWRGAAEQQLAFGAVPLINGTQTLASMGVGSGATLRASRDHSGFFHSPFFFSRLTSCLRHLAIASGMVCGLHPLSTSLPCL